MTPGAIAASASGASTDQTPKPTTKTRNTTEPNTTGQRVRGAGASSSACGGKGGRAEPKSRRASGASARPGATVS